MYTSTRKTSDILVIGGGATGMMAALFAARAGAKVTLLEKNEKLGKKVYITGKGRCNVTNVCEDIQDFLREVPRNPRFLYSALRLFSPLDMLALLNELGCETKIERGRRAFPVTDHASDVTKAMEKGLRQAGAEIRLHTEVKRVLADETGVRGVELANGQILNASKVIVCTGGISYPSTGSTGDGYRWANETGHPVSPARPSLVGLRTKETWPMELQGLTLKNICLTGYSCGKIIYSEQGELLFTHFGVSGPLAIECSCHLPESGQCELLLDLKPGLTGEQLDQRLTRELSAAGKKQLSTVMQSLLPLRFAALFPDLCGVDGKKPCSQVSGKTRAEIAGKLKALPLTVIGTRPINEAIITRGGVDVKSLSPGTMESKKVPGLYFAGEVIDVDAHTGGYNLQIAWSTGALAGKSAAEAVLEEAP
ncbi:MAG: NAD(P)/FAD-dependent oxidoreductase [Clostridia bacterium]|nr:NAD(P)/FAD-dependent oxidoreductase [Clostridia bacterium]